MSDSGYLTPSAIYTTLTGSGTVSFWWRVSSDYREGGLAFTVDGVEQDRIVGETPWTRREIELGPGAHTLTWSFGPDLALARRPGGLGRQELRLVRTTLAPKTASFGPAGGTGGASLTADSDVSWTAVSNAPWITSPRPRAARAAR